MDKPLTFEQMEGTKTFHFPLKRKPPGAHPRMTLVVKRTAPNMFHAGMSVCSLADNFSKRRGRRIAWNRLCGQPLTGDSKSLFEQLIGIVAPIAHRHPGTLGTRTEQKGNGDTLSIHIEWDLEEVCKNLGAYFDKLERNRIEKASRALT